MKTLFTASIGSLTALLTFVLPVHAQEAKSIINKATMQFSSPAQLRRMIPENADDLRKTFYLILNASQAGLAQTATLQYRELWLKKFNDPRLKAEYAFCHSRAVNTSPFVKLNAEQKRLQAVLEKPEYYQEVGMCRKESLEKLSKSAEVQIMAAMGDYELYPMPVSVARAEKSISLDPSWGYAHYWLGRSLTTQYDLSKSPDKTAGLSRALRELKISEELDPTIKGGNILSAYYLAYNGLGQYGKAIEYLDRCLERNARMGGSDIERNAFLRWKKNAEADLKAHPPQPMVPRRP